MELPVCITEEDNGYVVVCPLFHVASQGDTKDEALANIIEALELFLSDEDVQKEYQDLIKQCANDNLNNIVEIHVEQQTSFCIGT